MVAYYLLVARERWLALERTNSYRYFMEPGSRDAIRSEMLNGKFGCETVSGRRLERLSTYTPPSTRGPDMTKSDLHP